VLEDQQEEFRGKVFELGHGVGQRRVALDGAREAKGSDGGILCVKRGCGFELCRVELTVIRGRMTYCEIWMAKSFALLQRGFAHT